MESKWAVITNSLVTNIIVGNPQGMTFPIGTNVKNVTYIPVAIGDSYINDEFIRYDEEGNPTSIEQIQDVESRLDNNESVINNLCGGSSDVINNQDFVAKQINLATQSFIITQDFSDSQAMQFADIYPLFEELVEKGEVLAVSTIFSYGKNTDGETQLYKNLVAVVPTEVYLPSETPTVYKAIGYDENGYMIWSQPYGAGDEYRIGDVVNYDGLLYVSTNDANVWNPTNVNYWGLYTV